MKKTILMSLVVIAALLTGCDETTTAVPQGDTTINTNGGDVVINDVQVDGEGTYISNGDGTITYTNGTGNSVGTDGTSSGAGSKELGVYSASYSQSKCTEEGYFYCTLENKCLNQPATGGSCTSTAKMTYLSIETYVD